MTAEDTMAGHYRTTGATPGGARTGGTSTYSALLAQVKEAGLLRRRRGFYWALFSALVVATAACWVAFALLGDSWFQLIVAGALGVVFT
ncbi:acyl-CoA desaturase, partial [Curtobacterium sp. SAFR-003]